MLRTDIICYHAGVLQIDGIDIHTDGEGADRMGQEFLGYGADEGGIQTAGKQEAYRSIGIQALLHAVHQQAAELCADILFRLHGEITYISRICVLNEFAVHPVMTGREGKNRFAKAHEVLRLAGEGPFAVFEAAVIEGRIPIGSRAAMTLFCSPS